MALFNRKTILNRDNMLSEPNRGAGSFLNDIAEDHDKFKSVFKKGKQAIEGQKGRDDMFGVRSFQKGLTELFKEKEEKERKELESFQKSLEKQREERPEKEEKVESLFEEAETLGKFGIETPITDPGYFFVQPFLEEKGIPKPLAFGAGLGIDLLVPGPGEKVRLGKFTTKTLRNLVNMSKKKVVSKGFIEDLLNKQGVVKAEKEAFQEAMEKPGVVEGRLADAKVNTERLIEEVEDKLLPLETTKKTTSQSDMFLAQRGGRNLETKYENVALPDEVRGNVVGYGEKIYESPIPTSAGGKHFTQEQFPNYFAHTRLEDMADGDIRRVIEMQSDLFQKGGLELEFRAPELPRTDIGGTMIETPAEAAVSKKMLQPYRNDWWKRITKQEVRKAAEEGKEKLQFPTGRTANEIESGTAIGPENPWRTRLTREEKISSAVPPDEIGQEASVVLRDDYIEEGRVITDSSTNEDWIITKVLGDKEFKAVSDRMKNLLEEKFNKPFDEIKDIEGNQFFRNAEETLNIEREVIDKSDPIYKFYEDDVGKYLENNFDAKRVTDDQGVEWFQVDVPETAKDVPIEVFGGAGTKTLIAGGAVAGATVLSPVIAGMLDKLDANNQEDFQQGIDTMIGNAETQADLGAISDKLDLIEDDNQRAEFIARIADKYSSLGGTSNQMENRSLFDIRNTPRSIFE